MLDAKTKSTDTSLPEGFERVNEDQKVKYHVSEKKGDAPQMNFRGPGRGGPSRMGAAVEKPADAKKTLSRLLKYFSRSKYLLIMLLIAVVFVTAAALLAPALQGEAIDDIDLRKWNGLYTCLIVLGIVYACNVLFTLAQAVFAAKLSQSIVKNMRHDLFKKIIPVNPQARSPGWGKGMEGGAGQNHCAVGFLHPACPTQRAPLP